MLNSSHSDFIQSEILSESILIKIGSADLNDYEEMFLWVNIILDSRRLDALDKNLKFAIAMIIVGLKKTEFFVAAFRILCDWEDLNGCFWIIQEELLRHATLGELKKIVPLNDVQNGNLYKEMKEILPKFVPLELPSYINHKIVRLKIPELRKNFESLIDSLELSEYPNALLVRYEESFPLDSFVNWYLDWAKTIWKSVSYLNIQRKYKYSFVDAPDNNLHYLQLDKYRINSFTSKEKDILIPRTLEFNENEYGNENDNVVPYIQYQSSSKDINAVGDDQTFNNKRNWYQLNQPNERIQNYKSWVLNRRLENENISTSSGSSTFTECLSPASRVSHIKSPIISTPRLSHRVGFQSESF